MEERIKGKPPDERDKIRQAETKPRFDALVAFLTTTPRQVSGKSSLSQAICYALTRLPWLGAIFENGILEIDTDDVEKPLSRLSS